MTEIPALSIVFFRFFIPFLFMIPYFLYHRIFFPRVRKEHIVRQIVRAIFVVLGQVFLFIYIQKGSLLLATTLFNTAPIYIPLLSRLLYRHRISAYEVAAVLIGFIGIVILLKPAETFDFNAVWGILAGFCSSVSQILFGVSQNEERVQTYLFYFFFFSSVVSFFVYLISLSFEGPQIQFDSSFFWIAISLIAFGSIFNQFFKARSYASAYPFQVAPLIYLSVVFSGLFDLIAFGNFPDILFIVGAVLVAVSGAIPRLHKYIPT